MNICGWSHSTMPMLLCPSTLQAPAQGLLQSQNGHAYSFSWNPGPETQPSAAASPLAPSGVPLATQPLILTTVEFQDGKMEREESQWSFESSWWPAEMPHFPHFTGKKTKEQRDATSCPWHLSQDRRSCGSPGALFLSALVSVVQEGKG